MQCANTSVVPFTGLKTQQLNIEHKSRKMDTMHDVHWQFDAQSIVNILVIHADHNFVIIQYIRGSWEGG